MKRKILLVAQAILISFGLQAQISEDIEPYSIRNGGLLTVDQLRTNEMPSLDWDQIAQEDALDAKNGELYKISRHIPVDLDLTNSGLWVDVPGGKLWRLKIHSDGAMGINLYYDDFFMPNGATMHLYNHDKSIVLGAYTSKNNKEHGAFATSIVKGDVTIIEYFEPDHAIGEGRIGISAVSHCYRGVEDMAYERAGAERASDTCEVDVNCSEGDDWANQIKGVVRILVNTGGSSGWCSGSLINNTAEDCTPYILSALHCAENSSSFDFNNFVFYFNYEKSGCGSGTFSISQSMTGCTKRADSGDGGGDWGSDFLLLELDTDIPWTYDPYFNGWDANTSPAQSGVGIHHPSGDVKKISTFNSQVWNGSWGISGTHWRVQWVQTTNGHGVTEGGSSGSPLFNENKLIVGQLTGGASFCTAPNDLDSYGKMSWNWNSNPGDDLSAWLDPTSSGELTLPGRFYPCANDIDEVYLDDNTVLYPNPAKNAFVLEAKGTIENARVELYNGIGQLLQTFEIDGGVPTRVDISDYASGLYYVNIYSDQAKVTKKLVKSE